MAYENKCPFCGANLDPGERCEDCEGKLKIAASPKPVRPIISTDNKPVHNTRAPYDQRRAEAR